MSSLQIVAAIVSITGLIEICLVEIFSIDEVGAVLRSWLMLLKLCRFFLGYLRARSLNRLLLLLLLWKLGIDLHLLLFFNLFRHSIFSLALGEGLNSFWRIFFRIFLHDIFESFLSLYFLLWRGWKLNFFHCLLFWADSNSNFFKLFLFFPIFWELKIPTNFHFSFFWALNFPFLSRFYFGDFWSFGWC